MTDLAQICLLLGLAACCYGLGYTGARRSSTSIIAMRDSLAIAQVRFDNSISRADAMQFLDRTREAVGRGELLGEPEQLKDEGAANER